MPQDLDLSYLGLNLDDRDPQAIFDAALAKFQELAPTARLRNGSVETMLLEAWATASSDLIYALNRFPAAAVEGLLNLYGVPRSAGVAAAGVVTLEFDDVRTVTVEAGQRFSDPATGLVLEVSATTTGSSVSSMTVPAVCEEANAAGNSIVSGTALDLLDSIPYVISATVSTSFSGGVDPESDAAYIDRASTVLARVTSSLVLPVHFQAYLLQDVRVGRATPVDLYEPGGTPGSDLGHITCFTYGRGAQLTTEVRAELQAAMQAICSAMVNIHVEEATIVTQNLELEVVALPGYDHNAVRDAITAALTAWMSPDAWAWGRDIYTSEIIDVAADVPGVDYVTSVTTPAANVTINGDELAQAGVITVTVTA